MLVLCSVFLIQKVNAQKKYNGESYYKIVEEQDKYWEANKAMKNVKDSGFKQYNRWKHYMGTRCGNGGDLYENGKAIYDYINYVKEQSEDKSTTYPAEGNWSFLGPIGVPTKPNETYYLTTGKGQMCCLYVNPKNKNHLISGSMNGGVWRTLDKGNTWECISSSEPLIKGVKSISVHPSDPNIISLVTSEGLGYWQEYSNGIFITFDGGNTWNQVAIDIYPTTTRDNAPQKILVHPNNRSLIFLLTTKGIYRSSNGGVKWSKVLDASFTELRDIEFDTHNDQTLYASGGMFFKSADGGEIWNSVTSEWTDGLSGVYNSRIAVHENYPGRVWYIYYNYSNKMNYIKEYNSIDNSFTDIEEYCDPSSHSPYASKYVFEVSPNNPNIQYWGMLRMYETNSGTTSIISNMRPGYANSLHMDMRGLYVYNDNGSDILFTANDGGVAWGEKHLSGSWTWLDISDDGTDGLNITAFYGIEGVENDANLILGGTLDCSGFVYDNGSWINTSVGDGTDPLIDPENHDYMYIGVNTSSLYRSIDGGDSFEELYNHDGLAGFDRAMAFEPGNSNTLYYGEFDLVRYTNLRTSNTSREIIDIGNTKQIFSIAIASSNPDVIYVGTNKNLEYWDVDCSSEYKTVGKDILYKSIDRGESWIDISTYIPCELFRSNGFITDIEINPMDPDDLWISFCHVSDKPKVLHSKNGGKSWESFAEGLPGSNTNNLPVFNIELDVKNEVLYAATDVGVFSCFISDGIWSNYAGCEFKYFIVNDIEINQQANKIRAATFGRGLWEANLRFNPSQSTMNLSSTASAGNYLASGVINSTQQIPAGVSVNYVAGDEVVLNPSFQTEDNFMAVVMPEETGNVCDNITVKQTVERENPEIYEDDEFTPEKDLEIYPNPTNGSFNIMLTPEYLAVMPEATITIFDDKGKVILFKESVAEINVIDISEHPKGTYIVEISSVIETITTKVIHL